MRLSELETTQQGSQSNQEETPYAPCPNYEKIFDPSFNPEEVLDWNRKEGWIIRWQRNRWGAVVASLFMRLHPGKRYDFESPYGARFFVLSYFQPEIAKELADAKDRKSKMRELWDKHQS